LFILKNPHGCGLDRASAPRSFVYPAEETVIPPVVVKVQRPNIEAIVRLIWKPSKWWADG